LLPPPRHGSLAQFSSATVVAVPVQQPARRRRSPIRQPLQLIQGSLSAQRVERQAPWLSSLHRIANGSLAGLGLAVLGLSGLTLHWQGQWSHDFQQLEAAQRLEHRLQESAAVLEQHHLAMTHKPALLQPTSSEKLLYVAAPQQQPQDGSLSGLLAQVNTRQIPSGY
jgi:hypothetical protein